MTTADIKQQYEKMFVIMNEKWLDDPNHHNAIEDMTGYIERMGGKLNKVASLPRPLLRYEWTVPVQWTGKLYERFNSFGLHPSVNPDSMWFGVLDEDSEDYKLGVDK